MERWKDCYQHVVTCVHQLHFVKCSWTSEVPLQSVHKRQVQNKIAKRKKTSRTNPIRIIHATYGGLFKSRFNSILSSNLFKCDTNSCKLLQLFGAICSKGPYGIYYIVGALQKWPNLSKSLTFSFFSNLNSENFLYDFTAKFFPV